MTKKHSDTEMADPERKIERRTDRRTGDGQTGRQTQRERVDLDRERERAREK